MSLKYNKLLLILLAGFAFGSSVVSARFALKGINPYTLIVLRFGIASIAYIFLVMWWKRKIPSNKKILFDMSLVGLFGTGLPILLFLISLLYLSSGMFTILFAVAPLFTALLAHYFLKDEKLNPRLLIGLAISLLGVIYLISTRTNGLVENFNIVGPLLVFVGILAMAGGSVYTRIKLKSQDPFMVSTVQTVAGFFLLFVLVASAGKFNINGMDLPIWLATIYNGFFGSFVAFWATFSLIKKFGATAGALSSYVMPVVSSVFGALLLGEVLSLSLFIGAVLIFFGLSLTILKTSNSH